jgi:RsiW-degrading membrane proteinase PrsW (M82 family)
MDSTSLYFISGLLAFIPALIWLSFLIKNSKNRKIQTFIFLTGIFSVLPVFLINMFFYNFPEYDFISYFDKQITNIQIHFLLTLAWVSIIEELIKQWVVRFVDERKLIVETINDSIRFSLIAALGFSFAENLFYFYQIGTELSSMQFFSAYLFRSIFTTCAHLVFSGFFGYYYGIAKFSIDIYEQSKWLGKKFIFVNFFSKLLNISRIQAYREMTIIKGLLLAIILHTTFNYLLAAINQIIPAALFILLSYIYLRHLLKNRAGQLVLLHDSTVTQTSTMTKKDEEVVIELLGMWSNEKRYVDVIHICERLLKRDPDNQVIQLFKAKAMDQVSPDSPYGKILQKMFPNKSGPSLEEMEKNTK